MIKWPPLPSHVASGAFYRLMTFANFDRQDAKETSSKTIISVHLVEVFTNSTLLIDTVDVDNHHGIHHGP